VELLELQKVLENLGLEEKEVKVYLALLPEGEATATKLSQYTALDRTLMSVLSRYYFPTITYFDSSFF